jgi:hypothetical protein
MAVPPELKQASDRAHQALLEYDEAVANHFADEEVTPEPPVAPKPPVVGKTKRRFSLYPGADSTKANAVVRDFHSKWHSVQQVGNNQDQRIEGAGGSIHGIYVNPKGYNMLSDLVHVNCTAIQLAFTGVDGKDTTGKEPRAVKRGALTRTVRGEHDEMYTKAFEAMKKSPWETIILRLGSEGDIPFPPHSFVPGTDGGKGNDDIFREAYRHVRRLAVQVIGQPRVKFTCTTTAFAGSQTMVCADGKTRTMLEAGFPGKDVVDYMGIDFYLGGDSLEKHKDRFRKHVDFALAQGLPLAIDEWGITPDAQTKQPPQTHVDYIKWVDEVTTERAPYISFFLGWAKSKFPDDYSAPAREAIKRMRTV